MFHELSLNVSWRMIDVCLVNYSKLTRCSWTPNNFRLQLPAFFLRNTYFSIHRFNSSVSKPAIPPAIPCDFHGIPMRLEALQDKNQLVVKDGNFDDVGRVNLPQVWGTDFMAIQPTPPGHVPPPPEIRV